MTVPAQSARLRVADTKHPAIPSGVFSFDDGTDPRHTPAMPFGATNLKTKRRKPTAAFNPPTIERLKKYSEAILCGKGIAAAERISGLTRAQSDEVEATNRIQDGERDDGSPCMVNVDHREMMDRARAESAPGAVDLALIQGLQGRIARGDVRAAAELRALREPQSKAEKDNEPEASMATVMQDIDVIYAQWVRRIRKSKEKPTGAEIDFLEKMEERSTAAQKVLSAGEVRVIAQDQVNVRLQGMRPVAAMVCEEILHDKKAPAAVRLEAAKFARLWADEEEPPEEPVEFVIVDPKQKPKIVPIQHASATKCESV